MMKRLLSMFLALSLLASAAPVQAFAETADETLEPAAVETVAVQTLPAETAAETTVPEETVIETTPETAAVTEPQETAAEEPAVETEEAKEGAANALEEEEIPELTVGESLELTLSASGSLDFLFTPEESGSYVFWEDTYAMPLVGVYGEEDLLAVDVARVEFYAEAGVTYTLAVENIFEEDMDICLNLDYAEDLERIVFLEEAIVGAEGEDAFQMIEFVPANAHVEEVVWEIDNEEIAELLDANNLYAEMSLLAPGSATLTATSGDISADCTIEVTEEGGENPGPGEVVVVTEPFAEEVTLEPEEDAMVTFRPKESGNYVLSGELYLAVLLEEEAVAEGEGQVEFAAEAGVDYTLYIYNHTEETVTTTVKLEKAAAPKPGVPELKAAHEAKTGKPVLSWEAVENAEEYRLYRATSEDGSYRLVTSTKETAFVNTAAVPGKTYYYKIKALNADGSESEYSDVLRVVCKLADAELTADNVKSSGKVKLTWEAVEGAVSYKIYRSENGEDDYSLAKTTTGTSYTNTAGVGGVTYDYKVEAVAENEEANSESLITATCDLKRPTVRISTNADAIAFIEWNAIDDAVGYAVYWSDSKDGEYTLLGSVEETLYTDSGKAGETRYYQVVALAENPEANSAPSLAKAWTTQVAVPVVTIENVESSGKIRLTWNKVPGAIAYKVYRSTTRGGSYSLMKTTTGTSYTNTSATAGKTYYYKVKAISANEEANSDFSPVKFLTCDLKRPVITLTKTDSGSIKITWKAVSGAVKYKVYRSLSGEKGTWSLLKTTTGTKLTNTSVEAGTTYYYRVQAIAERSSANSAYSLVKSTTCTLVAPEIKLGNDAGSGCVEVSWKEISGAQGYEIWRSINSDKDFVYRASVDGDETEWTDYNTVPGTAYYYKVKALADEESANSGFSAVKYRTCDLERPVITVGNLASTGKVKVSWDAVYDAVAYKVYRSTSKTGTYTLVKTTSSTSFTDTEAVAGQTYYYKVKAVATNSAADSAYSTAKSRTCDLKRPVVTIKDNDGNPRLTWKAISGAVKYQIYRSEDGESWDLMKTTTGTSYTNTKDVEEGVTYYYRVKAVAEKSSANSAYSLVKEFTAE